MSVLPQGLTQTIEQAPIVEAFQAARGIEDLVIVADAGMLSAANLTALDEARLRFIVRARQVRALGDLEAHFHWAGDAFTDGQVIDTITPKRAYRSQRDVSRRHEPVWDRSPIRARGERYGPTPRSERPGTTRP